MPRIAQEFADIPFAQLAPGSVHRARYALTPDLLATYARLVGDPAPDEPDGTHVFTVTVGAAELRSGRPTVVRGPAVVGTARVGRA